MKVKLIFAIVIMLIGSAEALACSCIWPPPVAEVLKVSDAVVVAKLVKVDDRNPQTHYNSTAQLTLEKVYKGPLKRSETLTLWRGEGGNCIFPFREDDIGKSFLLYLSPPVAEYPMRYMTAPPTRADPLRFATICDRSARKDHAAADLSFLNRFEELKDKTRLTATFVKGMYSGPNISNLKVKITGEKGTLELAAKDGFIETYELQPGRYTVTFATEPGWLVEPWALRPRDEQSIGKPYINEGRHEIPIEIGAAQHIELRIYMLPSAAVKGRVLSPLGQPMKGASVCMAEKIVGPNDWCRIDRTNESGDFTFSATPAGKYYLIVNHQNRITAEQPFKSVLYPGVVEPGEARSITVGTAEISDLIIQIPETVELVTIKGRTVFADEKPTEARVIRFVPSIEGYAGLFGRSFETGEFEITVPSTAKGTISAEIQIGKDHSRDCPAHLKLFEGSRESWISLKSNEVSFPLVDPANIVLTFPTVGCSKNK